MPHLVVIADVVASRELPDRADFQSRLRDSLNERNRARSSASLLSPYTLTLGDEFQVVPAGADGLFHDLLTISADLKPVKLRFALAVGAIDTPINPERAIGMDGSAFHLARDGIELLKRSGGLCRMDGLDEPLSKLVNNALALAFAQLDATRGSRLPLAAGLLAGDAISKIATRLGKSEQTLYKTARSADLYAVTGLLQTLEVIVDQALGAPSPSPARR